jgi:acetyl-CoA carboxylase biotin carboxyl carrier protein
MPLSEDDIREILRLIDESDVAELRIETEDLSLHVIRDDAAPAAAHAETAATPEAEAPTPPVDAATDGQLTISAPMLGTFYRAPAPGAPSFVDVGTRVQPDTIVCLIEVMKMMNPVQAGVAGTIVEVCVENADFVEYGAPLFQVRGES